MITASEFSQAIDALNVGKKLPDTIYLHRSALETQAPRLYQFALAIAKALKISDDAWNIIKLSKRQFALSLLNYPSFYTEAYPALCRSISIDLTKLNHRVVDYTDSDNPPILHRKELMVLATDPHYGSFALITQEGENAGLYENTRLIGFKSSWEAHIAKHGYVLVDGRLFRASMLPEDEQQSIDRHKTALVRHSLSSPMKSLAKHGFLNGDYSIFDYGCGRGDDLRELQCHGLDALGWDPNHYPEGEKAPADIVNLGFVLNVIEDKHERLEALIGAWELSQQLIVVSVMLANDDFIAQFTPYKDGVITSRNTFQKYYQQAEVKAFIERSLDESAIAVAPGIFYVFKDKLAEQRYLSGRYRRSQQWRQLSSPPSITSGDKARLLVAKHQELFGQFWQAALELGRCPQADEFKKFEEIRTISGSVAKALRILLEIEGLDDYELAVTQRSQDLLLFFAMSLFEKRRPYTQLPERLKRDIKAFFNDHNSAFKLAAELLFKIADTEAIEATCNQAHQSLPASILNPGHSLIFHKDHLTALPLLLRVYVGAGMQLYGELDDIDLIKIHITSGKLTLTGYDDFEKSVPFLKERVKIKMAEQDIDFFDYINEAKRPPLLNRALYLPSSSPVYEQQQSFDKRLAKLLGTSSTEEAILTRIAYDQALEQAAKQVKGFKLYSADL